MTSSFSQSDYWSCVCVSAVCDMGKDGRHMTDQGIQASDIPPREQIHPEFRVKNATPRCCSAADEWSDLSCHWGSAGEVTSWCTWSPVLTPTRLYLHWRHEKEREREYCSIKHFFSPSRAHITSSHPEALPPWAPGLTHLYVFPSDLSASFLPAPVNHKLIYEGNF